jgi:rhodanese-related sulfurtransferase
MLYAALGIAVVAIVIALRASATAAGLKRSIEESAADGRRRAENVSSEVEEKLGNLRRLMSQMAAGASVTPDMILEGRLWRDVSTKDAVRLVQSGDVRLLDVRTPQETSQGIIPGAALIPVDQLEHRWKEIPRDEKTLLVYCAGGGRSSAACEFLSQQGYENLLNLEGGFSSWSGPTGRPA